MKYHIQLNAFLILFSFVPGNSIAADNVTDVKPESTSTVSLPLFSETSITKSHLNKQGLKWDNILGDWVDLNGTPQGKVPWASAVVTRKSQGPIILDVTSLVKEQQHKKNQLMILSATIPVKISSREGIKSPTLKITLQDESLLAIDPELDASNSLSTVRNLNTDTLVLDPKNSKSFIQFKLPKEKIKSANLELWPIKIYGSGQIMVFNLTPQNTQPPVKKGIINGLASYASLKGHPEIIFIDTFDNTTIKPEWFKQGKVSPGEINNGYYTGEINPKLKNHSAVNLRYFFNKQIKEEPTEVYFRYSIRFHKDFIYATEGGKLPGQAGTYNKCGWGGRKPDQTCQGWSARMLWSLPKKEGTYKDLIPIGTYLYHLGQKSKYGDNERWKAFCKMGQWCELEQYVKLNTPGKNDGILRGYHNGKLVYERKDIRYRDDENTKIEDAWTLVYHGGLGYPMKPIHIDIDNIVISRSYVGLVSKIKKKSQVNPEELKPLPLEQKSAISNPPDSKNNLNAVNNITPSNTIPVRHINKQLENIADNTAMDLGSFSCNAPQGDNLNCARVTDYSGMVYDQNHHQILMFGGGHATTFTDTVFIFNIKSLRWKEDYPATPCTKQSMNLVNFDKSLAAWKTGPVGPYPRPISRHTYDLLAVAKGLPELIVLIGSKGESSSCPPDSVGYSYTSGGKVSHYQLTSKTWSFSNTAEGDGRPYKQSEFTASEYDPISGLIILLGRHGLYTYDPISRTKKRIIDNISMKSFSENLGYANELVYYPPNDRLYYFNRNSQTVWMVILDRKNLSKSTVEKVLATGSYPKHREPGYAYDSANGIIGGAVQNNRFYIFDPKTNSWSNQIISGPKPGTMAFHAIAYNPVDNVFFFLTKEFKTWAYRYH